MVMMIIIVEHLRFARHCALITFLTQRLMLLTTLCIKYYFYFPVEETEAQSDESLIVQSYTVSVVKLYFFQATCFHSPVG